MKTLLLTGLIFSSLVHAEPLIKNNLKTWAKSEVQPFGCFLERQFKHRDAVFNCSLRNYKNAGDPCKNTKAYYEGPAFPEGKAQEVHPLIEKIELSWEQGKLQSVVAILNKKMNETEARKTFNLSATDQVQDCSLKATCVVFVGFDHQGAGDVDCSE